MEHFILAIGDIKLDFCSGGTSIAIRQKKNENSTDKKNYLETPGDMLALKPEYASLNLVCIVLFAV